MSWKRESGSSRKPIAAHGALRRCAIDTGSAGGPATSGWIDGGGLDDGAEPGRLTQAFAIPLRSWTPNGTSQSAVSSLTTSAQRSGQTVPWASPGAGFIAELTTRVARALRCGHHRHHLSRGAVAVVW